MSLGEKKQAPDKSRNRRFFLIEAVSPQRHPDNGNQSFAAAKQRPSQQTLKPASISYDTGRSTRFTSGEKRRHSLYTAEQKQRRDATAWTLVQGILAPVQFAVFLISLILVVRYLWTGSGYDAAAASVIAKTVALYAIMITGSIWEKVVFGRYLFAPAFFWEDAVSMLVLALHTAYLVALFTGTIGERAQMLLALAAYATYLINAAQFILKLRAARLSQSFDPGLALAGAAS